MDLSVPTILTAFKSAGSAMVELSAWKAQAKGNQRAIIAELKRNMHYLDMVAEDGVPLGNVVEKLADLEYKKLYNQGYNFNSLKKGKIAYYPSLDGTDLARWQGKETGALVHSIYEKIDELKIKHPHVGSNSKYRWGVRVNNIRKRVWLLLKHVRS